MVSQYSCVFISILSHAINWFYFKLLKSKIIFDSRQFNRSSANRGQWHGKRDDCIVHKNVLTFASTKDQGQKAGDDVPWTESNTNIRLTLKLIWTKPDSNISLRQCHFYPLTYNRSLVLHWNRNHFHWLYFPTQENLLLSLSSHTD